MLVVKDSEFYCKPMYACIGVSEQRCHHERDQVTSRRQHEEGDSLRLRSHETNASTAPCRLCRHPGVLVPRLDQGLVRLGARLMLESTPYSDEPSLLPSGKMSKPMARCLLRLSPSNLQYTLLGGGSYLNLIHCAMRDHTTQDQQHLGHQGLLWNHCGWKRSLSTFSGLPHFRATSEFSR